MDIQPNNNAAFTILEDDNANLKQEFNKYLRQWPWFVFALIIALASAYLYVRYAPRIYETSAKIKILDESEGLELPTSAFIFKRKNINLENEMEIIRSYQLLEKVAKRLKLNTVFFEEGTIQTAQIAELPFEYQQLVEPESIEKVSSYAIEIEKETIKITDLKTNQVYNRSHVTEVETDSLLPFSVAVNNQLSYDESAGKRYTVYLGPLKKATLALRAQLSVESVGDVSDLLKLTIRGESRLRSERILNTLLQVFNNDGIKDRQLVSQRTLDFIDDRFIYLAEELDSIEVDRKEFKQRNNLIDLSTDAELGLQLRSRSDDKVFEIESQIALVEVLKNSIVTDEEGKLIPEDVGLQNRNVNSLIGEYNQAVLDKDKLISSGGGGINNPTVQLTKARIKDLTSNITKSLESYYKQLELSQSQLRSRNRELSGTVAQIPKKEKLLRAIERQQTIKESLYLLLLQKREEAAINLAITEPSIKVVDFALSSSAPKTPKPNVIYAASILGGFLVPFGVLFIIFMFDTKIHEKDDIVKLNNKIPIIAEIPDINKKEKTLFEDPNDRSVLAESFRILSSNVNYLIPLTDSDDGKVIYCTSTIKGEGKTFISINLSLALSSMNKKVLLIGADLRNPQIHTHTKFDKNTVGLSDYLNDKSIDWQSNLVKGFDNHPNHDILLSGNIPPNPTSLLTNWRYEDLINQAKKIYDYVIVDTAPTILVTDTMLISKFADVTVYIARANFTDKKILTFSDDLFKTGKLNNMAFVINGVGASKSYGYGYNYGYGYGYGSKEQT
ncbi:GumC family protein [Psychroserpens ponticola]|uniref:non-specific protein-tyrosine kinase n=1 Tax=Psychroserpens ponticola TaxID=2932268 RepID=A0ABY7RVH4_9FLAO|nr:tyrosine-protein kinase [Psychroserpens ponticola]WCO01120.1 polysaccharide biosynthesis tyrosine autokinase [Psychroserpens ponticola]